MAIEELPLRGRRALRLLPPGLPFRTSGDSVIGCEDGYWQCTPSVHAPGKMPPTFGLHVLLHFVASVTPVVHAVGVLGVLPDPGEAHWQQSATAF